MNNYLPSKLLFDQVCKTGLSFVRPLVSKDTVDDPYGWNYGTADPPSYWAYGRMRALATLQVVTSLKPQRVLEVAAGDAALCACLEQLGCEVVANDLREDNLKSSVAQFKNREKIRLMPGNVFDLRAADTGKFDLVVACEIIEHVADSVALLKHLKSFLTANGRILLTTPNGNYFRNKLPTYSQIEDFRALESKQFKPDSDGHLFLITPQEMAGLAIESGLEVEDTFVWGTPFITGESGFRYLKALPLPYHALESLCGRIPWIGFREWFCSSMLVVIANRG